MKRVKNLVLRSLAFLAIAYLSLSQRPLKTRRGRRHSPM